MSDLILSSLQMTSLEIAELVESNHADTRRSIERLAERGVIELPPTAEVSQKVGVPGPKTVSVYIFTGEKGKRDSIVVVAQLSPEFTARLVDRWQALESGAATPAFRLEPRHIGDVRPLIEANRLFRSNLSIAKAVFKGNQALLSANMATFKATGMDVLDNIGASHLIAKERDALLTATDIGERLGMSGQKVNTILEEKGLVLSFRDHKNRKQYELTENGAKLGEALDTGKKHGDGTPVKQIKWYSRIVDFLKGEQAA